MRHVIVMTATGSIGLMALFVVDLFSLFYVSLLSDQALKAGVGYASNVMFLAMSVNIGMTIAIAASVSRALGAGDRPRARRLAASGLTLTAILAACVGLGLFLARDWILVVLLHASGKPAEVASRFLAITLPANVPMGVGMAFSGVLRAAGDARRAMYVTLSGGIATAFLDPLLIFGLGLGVYGAAWATVASRFVFFGVGAYGAHRVHRLVARPAPGDVLRDVKPVMSVGLPSILANLATPVGIFYSTRVVSDFGESAIAAAAVIDRVSPVMFGVVFALTGSIGPIIGQNFGARLMSRVRQTILDSMKFSMGYVAVAWTILIFVAPWIALAFDARGESADYLRFFCTFGVSVWVGLTALFIANTVFNNLGYAFLAMVFNWGRATLGTIPFVAYGAHGWGVRGAMMGGALGSALFGLAATITAFSITSRLAKSLKAS